MAQFFPPDASGDAGRPPRRTGRPRRWLLRGLAVIVALSAVTAAAAGIYVGSVSKSFTGNVQHESLLPNTSDVPGENADDPSGSKLPASGNTGVNYVLMGSDSRDATNAGAGRSDSLMVLHLAADRKHAYLISFPRDMYVSIPGYGKNKINAAFALGGPQLAVATLEDLLDTRMDHVALIDFEGFIKLTDELGGVTVNNQYASSEYGYDFPAGKITISGAEALAYVRQRHQLPNGDLGRAERQRVVVKAILDKGLSPETLRNPVKFNGFVSGVAKHLTVDEGLTDKEIRSTALSLRLTPKDLDLLQAPISGFRTVKGQSVDVVDRDQMSDLAEALRTDTMDEYAGQ